MPARDTEGNAEAEARATLQAMVPRMGDPPHALLGVAETASAEALRQAFLRLTKVYHPNRFARFAPEVGRLANEVFLTIKRAYDQARVPAVAAGTGTVAAVRSASPRAPTPPPGVPVVRAPIAPAAPATSAAVSPPRAATGTAAPPVPSVPAAPAAHVRAPTLPRTPTPAHGIPRAVVNQPASGATPASEFDAALDLARRRLWADARQAFQRLAVANPHEKKYRAHMHWARGREAQEAGRTDEARAELQRALALAPDLAQARSALESLPPEPGPGNVLSRLFKR